MGSVDPERADITPLSGGCWRFGPFEVDEGLRELRRDGEPVAIEPKPFNLLLLLVRHAGSLLTRSELIETLWTGRIVSDSVLANCVAKLRQVLGDDDQSLVRTVHGYGFRFEAQPERVIIASAVAPPKIEMTAGDSPPLRPNWRLVRRLGKTGDTWLGEHDKTCQRRVFKFGDGPASLSRLKREVTLYRLLRSDLGDDLAVAPILDWNFDQPPWFVESQYFSGGSLQEWAELHGGVGALPLAQRLSIAAQIAETLAAVHQVGVLHKDLKPANVLINPLEDGEVRIRLCDFGSGLVLDPQRFEEFSITRLGFTAVDDSGSGTPLYFAPEVIGGQAATVKSDIYALGVILFQLVVGDFRRPLAPGWEREVDDELLREAIALAADGTPSRRLSDASTLSQRIRGLEETRAARRKDAQERAAAEFAVHELARIRTRRSRMLAVVATLLLALILIGGLYWKARQARLMAEESLIRVRAVADFLNRDVLDQIGASDRPIINVTVVDLLDEAASNVDTRFAKEPELAAEVYESLGNSYAKLERIDSATAVFEKALTIRARAPDEKALIIASRLVMLHYRLGDLPSKYESYKDLARKASASLGPYDLAVLRWRTALARSRGLLGDWQNSADELEHIRTDYEAHARPDPGLSQTLNQTLTMLYNDLGRYVEAEALLRDLLAKIQQDGTGDTKIAVLLNLRLGRTYTELGRFAEAEAALELSDALGKKWSTATDSDPLTHNLYLAQLRNGQGRAAEAASLMERQLHEVEGIDVGAMNQSFTEHRILGEAYQRLGRLSEADRELTRCVELTTAVGASHPWTRDARIALADIARQRRDFTRAWKTLSDPPVLSMQDLPENHPYSAELERVTGLLWRDTGDFAQAREHLSIAWRKYSALLPGSHWRLARLSEEIESVSDTERGAQGDKNLSPKRQDSPTKH